MYAIAFDATLQGSEFRTNQINLDGTTRGRESTSSGLKSEFNLFKLFFYYPDKKRNNIFISWRELVGDRISNIPHFLITKYTHGTGKIYIHLNCRNILERNKSIYIK